MHILSLKDPSDATLASFSISIYLFKMASKMAANYKLKNCVV